MTILQYPPTLPGWRDGRAEAGIKDSGGHFGEDDLKNIMGQKIESIGFPCDYFTNNAIFFQSLIYRRDFAASH